ncbi:hypothetical protein [Lysinibacillus xylanilyticus]|uniref:hypothetical protein n=1 Tax=Lysinibacillus xylanilyticus TaxID=582475 RepID=UPI003D982901
MGIVVLTALLSISGTFLIMKKNYENEDSKRVETELDNVQTISKEDEKEKFVSTVDTSGMGWETPEYSKGLMSGKVVMNPLLVT